jgi:excisionase family DNA binding protein
MENSTSSSNQKWYSIKEAAEYLDIGEPTLYRWMRDGIVTYRKVGDSTRFWKEDLDSVMQVFFSKREAERIKAVCPYCHYEELSEGLVQSTGKLYFRPKSPKFWTLKDSYVPIEARMCLRCGGIFQFGDLPKLQTLLRDGARKK